MRSIIIGLVFVVIGGAAPAAAQDRMPPIPADKLTPAQKKAVEEFKAARSAEISGPFVPLLRSPEVMNRARAMGDYLRFKSSLPARLSEFVILMTARRWTQQYEWNAHRPLALKGGLSADVVNAIAVRRRESSSPAVACATPPRHAIVIKSVEKRIVLLSGFSTELLERDGTANLAGRISCGAVVRILIGKLRQGGRRHGLLLTVAVEAQFARRNRLHITEIGTDRLLDGLRILDLLGLFASREASLEFDEDLLFPRVRGTERGIADAQTDPLHFGPIFA
jgi:hypothetical protein